MEIKSIKLKAEAVEDQAYVMLKQLICHPKILDTLEILQLNINSGFANQDPIPITKSIENGFHVLKEFVFTYIVPLNIKFLCLLFKSPSLISFKYNSNYIILDAPLQHLLDDFLNSKSI